MFSSNPITAPSGWGSPHCQNFTIALTHTRFDGIPLDEWSAWQRDINLHITEHSQETNIHASSGIRTCNPGKQSDTDACLWLMVTGIRETRPYWIQIRSASHLTATVRDKSKVKFSRYRPGVAQRVGRSIALLFHDRGTRRGWVVNSMPRPHFTPPGKDPVPILQESGRTPGPVRMGGKSHPHRDSILDCPARSQSLYRLSYAAHRDKSAWT